MTTDRGERLKAARKKHGLTQAAMGHALACRPETLSRIETGRQDLSDGMALRIEGTMGISAAWLMYGGPGEPTPEDSCELPVVSPQAHTTPAGDGHAPVQTILYLCRACLYPVHFPERTCGHCHYKIKWPLDRTRDRTSATDCAECGHRDTLGEATNGTESL